MTQAPFVLASASPRRLELLRQIGIAPDEVLPADIDETPRKAELPKNYVLRMAVEKARVVREKRQSHIVLSADTVVALGRRILPKGETEDVARKCLALLSGRRHTVMTAVCVVSELGVEKNRVVSSTLRFKRLTSDEIDDYIASGEWQGKAGAYAVQGKAAGLIPFMSGSYSNIVGLPLFETTHLLKACGHAHA